MNSKNRALLRSEAQKIDSIIQIGKDGLTDAVILTARQAINNRELIKLSVLESCDLDINELANKLSTEIKAEIIQIIGKKVILYKRSNKNLFELK